MASESEAGSQVGAGREDVNAARGDESSDLLGLAKIGIQAFNEKRPELAEFFIDPDFQFQPFGAVFLGGKTYVGPRGLWEYRDDVDEAFESLIIEPEQYVERPGVILIVGTFKAKGRASEIEFEAPYAGVAHFRDNKAISLRTYFELAEALEAAGLTADEIDRT